MFRDSTFLEDKQRSFYFIWLK